MKKAKNMSKFSVVIVLFYILDIVGGRFFTNGQNTLLSGLDIGVRLIYEVKTRSKIECNMECISVVTCLSCAFKTGSMSCRLYNDALGLSDSSATNTGWKYYTVRVVVTSASLATISTSQSATSPTTAATSGFTTISTSQSATSPTTAATSGFPTISTSQSANFLTTATQTSGVGEEGAGGD